MACCGFGFVFSAGNTHLHPLEVTISFHSNHPNNPSKVSFACSAALLTFLPMFPVSAQVPSAELEANNPHKAKLLAVEPPIISRITRITLNHPPSIDCVRCQQTALLCVRALRRPRASTALSPPARSRPRPRAGTPRQGALRPPAPLRLRCRAAAGRRISLHATPRSLRLPRSSTTRWGAGGKPCSQEAKGVPRRSPRLRARTERIGARQALTPTPTPTPTLARQVATGGRSWARWPRQPPSISPRIALHTLSTRKTFTLA
jgi:hypothetical protein